MSDLLYSVSEIYSDTGYLASQKKKYFNIPLYQRGYKWEPKHVLKLLEDINKFNYENDKFYCLQNITIVPNDSLLNVVDGQQRLTTLTLILHYLGENAMVKNKVRFPNNSIRQETNNFLHHQLNNDEFNIRKTHWSAFINSFPNFDHQDIYHLFQAYKTIDSWFSEKQNHTGFSNESYKQKLLEHVKFIVNLVNDTTSEEKIFSNLNSKRIPLDGADIIRAALVTRVAMEETNKETDVRKIVMVNERRIKIGWVIDQMSNWWGQKDVSGYFNKFVNIGSEESGGLSLFNQTKHPINLLYLLYAESCGEIILTLDFIEKKNNQAAGLYKALLKLHNTLKDWYEDREIYHLLGYLFNCNGHEITFKFTLDLWNEESTRSSFISRLKEIIVTTLEQNNQLVDFSNIDDNWYHKNTSILLHALILLDVIHSLKENQSFMPFKGFSKNANDIEHIFPQQPKDQKDKKSYIFFLNNHIIKDTKAQFDLSEYDQKADDEVYLKSIDEFIDKHVGNIKIHSIGNLVLLYSSLNRSLGNSTYGIKRSRVIEYFNNGNYIQPHTFHVFVRYFNDKEGNNYDLDHWTNKDIEANAMKIDETIRNFLHVD